MSTEPELRRYYLLVDRLETENVKLRARIELLQGEVAALKRRLHAHTTQGSENEEKNANPV